MLREKEKGASGDWTFLALKAIAFRHTRDWWFAGEKKVFVVLEWKMEEMSKENVSYLWAEEGQGAI